MFECAQQMLIQLIGAMPILIGVYILFDLIGNLFFGKKWLKMKKFLLGSLFTTLLYYAIGTSYIIYKIPKKELKK